MHTRRIGCVPAHCLKLHLKGAGRELDHAFLERTIYGGYGSIEIIIVLNDIRTYAHHSILRRHHHACGECRDPHLLRIGGIDVSIVLLHAEGREVCIEHLAEIIAVVDIECPVESRHVITLLNDDLSFKVWVCNSKPLREDAVTPPSCRLSARSYDIVPLHSCDREADVGRVSRIF